MPDTRRSTPRLGDQQIDSIHDPNKLVLAFFLCVLSYSWLVEARREIPKGAVIEAELHNPADFSNPIRANAVELQAQSGESPWSNRRFYVLSPRMETLTCGLHPVKLTLYKDQSKTTVLGTHENAILSRIDTQYCMKDEFIEKMKEAAKHAEWKPVQSDSKNGTDAKS